MQEEGYFAWEHNHNRAFLSEEWRKVASDLRADGKCAVLVLNNAHLYLPDINDLVDQLSADENENLKLIISSANNHWRPRLKSPNLSINGEIVYLSKLDSQEITALLNLVRSNQTVSRLVDKSFKGFDGGERRRRLTQRCSRDFFVCLKNIFANDSFDTIVLREFADIHQDYQVIYKYLCALVRCP